MTTTMFETPFGDFTPTEDIVGLLYLVNGVLCLFVFEAVRRKRVVNVAIPLRRVTILGLTLSIPALVLHHQVDRIEEQFELPSWAWLVVGSVVLFLLSRLHELGVELADHFFNRRLDRGAAHMLEDALFRARAPSDIERVLVDEPMGRLSLGSAAVFRKSGAIFQRDGHAPGWEDRRSRSLRATTPCWRRWRAGWRSLSPTPTSQICRCRAVSAADFRRAGGQSGALLRGGALWRASLGRRSRPQ